MAVLALGHPAENWRQTGRKSVDEVVMAWK